MVHVHGGDLADTVRIKVAESASGSDSAGDSITVQVNDWSMNYAASTVTEIHLRLHNGNDVLNVQPSLTHNIHAFAGAGNDRILSGAGSDWLVGGLGDDFIAGRGNRDLIHGDDDWVHGGNDTLLGGADNDTLEGFAGNDKLIGGSGLDIVSGGEGDDIVDGGNDDDLAWSGKGRDRIVNPPGRDEPRDAKPEDTILATTPEELIFAELSVEVDGATESDTAAMQGSASVEDSSADATWESYGYSGTVGPLWMRPVFGNTTYHPEGVGDTFWPFEIVREDAAGAEVEFGLGYHGAATPGVDFSGQTTVLVGETESVSVNVYDDDHLENTEDILAIFETAIVPSDPGAFIIVDYPAGQPSLDPDFDPYSATAYIVDGDLTAYDSRGALGEVEEESGAFLQIGELYPLGVVLLDSPNATDDYVLTFPPSIAVWHGDNPPQAIASGTAIDLQNTVYQIEALVPVSNAVVSLAAR